MTYTDDDLICTDCVGEPYLSGEIWRKGKVGICGFCGQEQETRKLIGLANQIEEVVLTRFERTPEEPTEWQSYLQRIDKEVDHPWYREGQTLSELLTDEFNIHEDAAAWIENELRSRHYDPDDAAMNEETDFDSDAHYELRGISDERWAKEWSDFEQALKTEARFFSERAAAHLKSVFDGLHKFKTWSGKPVLTTIGPGHEFEGFYRARVFQKRDKLLAALGEPDLLIGPPTAEYAQGGRMNARGVSVFYGAAKEEVALAEVRPPVGSKVAVARFLFLRELKVLDLRGLADVRELVSVFDPNYLAKMEKAMFLRRLSARMTAPVMPDDEVFDYLPTQAVADYLASQTKVIYDGIIYPSVQAAGEQVNLVLFHKSARVEKIELPVGGRLHVMDEEYEEDGPFESYSVVEQIPARRKKIASIGETEPETDRRIPTLKVDLESMNVHEVLSVRYETASHSVTRRRVKDIKIKKIDLDF